MLPDLAPAGRLPLARHECFASDDFEAMHDRLCSMLKPHSLKPHDEPAPVEGLIRRARLGSLAFNVMRLGPAVDVLPNRLESFFLVQVPLAGEVTLTLGDERVRCRGMTGAVISPELPLHLTWSRGCAQLLIQIPRVRMEAMLAELAEALPGAPLRFDAALDFEAPRGAALRRLLGLAVDCLDRGDPLAEEPAFAAGLERLLVSNLLLAQPHNHRGLIDGRRGARPYYIARADTYMARNLERPIGLAELARATGVSARTLQSGYRRHCGTTPLRKLKLLRLNAARRALSAADTRARSVSEVALWFGFTQFGKFARDYRRLFGERPSETLRRKRALD